MRYSLKMHFAIHSKAMSKLALAVLLCSAFCSFCFAHQHPDPVVSAIMASSKLEPQTETREYNFDHSYNNSGIHWRCFPVLDMRKHESGVRYNELRALFNQHIAPMDTQLITILWDYDGTDGAMRYLGGDWVSCDFLASQAKGFKIIFFDNVGPIKPVVVDGLRADPAITPVKLFRGTEGSFENWIGYFVPQTQGVGDAFGKLLPNSTDETYLDHVYQIKAQHWSTRRITRDYDSPWAIDPNRYTVSEGDMLSIKLLPDAPREMYWACSTPAQSPRTREQPQHFSYVEEIDYIPIFIQFDPDNLPGEVGLMVAGECRGAAVVDSSLIEVNYYPTTAKGNDEIEILFYYGSKGTKKAPSGMVYNPETMLFEAGSLRASQIGEYGYISFYHEPGSSLVPLATELMQNYPNPFNGNTKISWILEKDEPVRIDIYNLRGQKVTTLYDGFGKKGRQSINWDAKDANGRSVASGVYFYRLSTSKESRVQKMMVIKK